MLTHVRASCGSTTQACKRVRRHLPLPRRPREPAWDAHRYTWPVSSAGDVALPQSSGNVPHGLSRPDSGPATGQTLCLGDLSEAKTSELLSSASHRDEGPRLRCPGNVLLGAGVPSGTPGPCVRHLWAAFCSLPCWTGRSGPRGHLIGGGPHPVACSPRQVAPLLGSSWRSRPGSGGPGRVGRAVVLGVGGGTRGPRGRRDGWQVARPGQLCPEEHGIGTRKRPCPQKTRPSEQRPPGESDLLSGAL